MTGFKFIDHDPRSGNRQKDPIFQEFADALRANPGRWAEYPHRIKAPVQVVCRINSKNGVRKEFADPGFEAISKDGVAYVRYNPENAQ